LAYALKHRCWESPSIYVLGGNAPILRVTCKSKDIIVVKGESWNSVMTTPNAPNSKPAKRSTHEDAYLLGELIGGVVEEIDRQMTLDDDVTDLRDSLDRAAKDRLEWEKIRSDTYESRSREIDRKWKRY
jgi:hypothetical protein